jgi:site-specific DNA-cytosine methylase
MVRSNFEHLLQDQFKVFEEAGYRVKSQILNASHYGVAQNRKRIFIVGIRSDFDIDYEFPLATHGDNLKPYTTIRDAIGHLPEWPMVSFMIQIFIGIICQEIVGKTGRRYLRRLSQILVICRCIHKPNAGKTRSRQVGIYIRCASSSL